MQEPVMVALDGSDKDNRVIAIAMAVARVAGSGLHFVRVLASPPKGLAGSGMDRLREVAAGERSAAEAELEAMASNSESDSAHRHSWAVLDSGDAAGALIQHALDREALVVVVGTRAPTPLSRAIIGSVADRVVRESPRPVMVVPPGAAHLGGKRVTLSRVLVPLDGSTLAFRSLEFIVDLPHANTMEYVLVEVVPGVGARATAQTRLQTTAAWLRSRGVKSVKEVVLQSGDPAAAILAVVREVFPEVIAMSSRGASGLGRLMIGSVAESVIRGSELPVFVLTPQSLAASRQPS